jgi:hypothetical protein
MPAKKRVKQYMTTIPHIPLTGPSQFAGMGMKEVEPLVVGSFFGVTMVVIQMCFISREYRKYSQQQ